jgi:hypothetical protein
VLTDIIIDELPVLIETVVETAIVVDITVVVPANVEKKNISPFLEKCITGINKIRYNPLR